MKLAIMAFLISFGAFAQTCNLTYESGQLSWTAFKTPKKVGVTAKFDKFAITPGTSGSSVETLLTGASFNVDTRSVNSGDKARDAKIISNFFKFAGKAVTISGKVLSAKDGRAQVELIMNDVKQNVDFTYKLDSKSNQLNLTSKIDVLKFTMQKHLAQITKACYEKHEGVTWPDVDLQLSSVLKKVCN
jgi:hypothetical protein